MSENKGTTITLPKGTKVIEQGGAFELGGTTGRLAEDARIVFDRVMDEDGLAAMFIAGGRPELLQTLKGKYNLAGARIADDSPDTATGAPVIDQPERDRIERQKIEDERIKAETAERDRANKLAAAQNQEKIEKAREEALRVAEVQAHDKAIAIDRDLRAKAAVADAETIKDDTRRASDRQIFAETNGGAVRGTEASLGEVSPDDLLNIPEDKKISPDKDTLDRERRAVDKIGMESAAVAKADKTSENFNEVLNKDGTNEPSVKKEISKEESVEAVDDHTAISLKEAAKGKKDTDKESKDTKTAEKVLKEEVEMFEKNKLETGKLDPKKDAKAKSSEEVAAVKTKAAEKAAKAEDSKLPVKK